MRYASVLHAQYVRLHAGIQLTLHCSNVAALATTVISLSIHVLVLIELANHECHTGGYPASIGGYPASIMGYPASIGGYPASCS